MSPNFLPKPITKDSNFIDRIQWINLMEDEGEVVTVGRSQWGKILEECSLSLLGHFLTTWPYNQRAAKSLLRTVLKIGSDLKIVDVGKGLFQFKFTMESQLLWIMNNRPWSFDGHILVLRRWEMGMTVKSVTFLSLPLLVQVWGLPFDLVSKEASRETGNGLGRVVKVNTKAFTFDQAHFIRVRAEIPLINLFIEAVLSWSSKGIKSGLATSMRG